MDITGKLLKKAPSNQNKEKFNLVQYLKDAKQELKKVSWPSKKDAWKQTLIVIGMSFIVSAFLGVWDWVFSYALDWYLKI